MDQHLHAFHHTCQFAGIVLPDDIEAVLVLDQQFSRPERSACLNVIGTPIAARTKDRSRGLRSDWIPKSLPLLMNAKYMFVHRSNCPPASPRCRRSSPALRPTGFEATIPASYCTIFITSAVNVPIL